MNHIKILDCTLRDGGYINNWEFGNKNILKVIEKLISSNIEIIECGFLDSNIDKEQDTTRFKNIDILNNLLQNINPNSNQLLVAMIDYNKYDLKSLPVVTKDSKITGLRVAFRKSNFKEALEDMKIIIEKGYKLFVQPMSTSRYSKEELVGKPHNIVRHPDMPKEIFKNMWNKIAFFMVVSFFEHIIIPVCITETGM